jgi:hypothetical protein
VQYASLQRRSTPARLHGAISQKALIFRSQKRYDVSNRVTVLGLLLSSVFDLSVKQFDIDITGETFRSEYHCVGVRTMIPCCSCTAWEVSLCQYCMKGPPRGRQRGKSEGGNFPFPLLPFCLYITSTLLASSGFNKKGNYANYFRIDSRVLLQGGGCRGRGLKLITRVVWG